nr:hypothetical protein [candidate division Zixibacteria bacterium]
MYALTGFSPSGAEYKGYDNRRYNRLTENWVVFRVESEYRLSCNWDFSWRWDYATGCPYTPLDTVASRMHNHALFDIHRINDARLPDYHSLSIRAERHFRFRGSSLPLYLSIMNLYNRKNVAGYIWKNESNTVDEINQLPFLPVVGMGYEF